MSLHAKNWVNILVQRQLDTISTGNAAYLETFLRVIDRAEMRTRIIFAPKHSFGNRPWAKIHERLDAFIDEAVWPKTLKINNYYWSLSFLVWWRFFVRALKSACRSVGIQVPVPSYLGRPLAPTEARLVARESSRHPSEITIAEYSSMGPVLSLLSTDVKRGVLMHDVLSDRGDVTRKLGLKPDLFEVTKAQEAAWCRDADLMIYASAKELDEFQPALPGTKAVWLRPEPPMYDETQSTGTPRVVFLGTTHAGNTDALQHFIAEIWPLVNSQAPDLEFWVAGSVGNTLTDAEKNTAGCKVLGRVDRLEDLGGADAIGVAPTRMATGVSIKVAEYLMLDMTCVAYPLALQGFQTALNGLVSIADTPEAFAAEILTLARDDAGRVSLAAKLRNCAQSALDNQAVVDFLHGAIENKSKD